MFEGFAYLCEIIQAFEGHQKIIFESTFVVLKLFSRCLITRSSELSELFAYYQYCRFYLLSGPYLDPLLTTFLLIRNYKTNHRTMRVKSNASFWGLDTIEVHHKLLLKPFELMFDHFEACQKQKLLSMLSNLRLKIVETLIWSFKRIFIHSRDCFFNKLTF